MDFKTLHEIETETSNDFPLLPIIVSRRLAFFPLFCIIFMMVFGLPILEIGVDSTLVNQTWFALCLKAFYSVAGLCVLAALFSAMCAHLGLSINLCAERFFGRWAAVFVHLLLIVSFLFPIGAMGLNWAHVIFKMTNLSSLDQPLYELGFALFGIGLFALSALGGLTTFIIMSFLYTVLIICVLVWWASHGLPPIVNEVLIELPPFSVAQWMRDQTILIPLLIPSILMAANVGRFGNNARSSFTAVFSGMVTAMILLVLLGSLLKSGETNFSIVNLIMQMGSANLALTAAIMLPILFADKAIYGASLSFCAIFHSVYRRRWVLFSFVLVGCLAVYEFYATPLDSSKFILRIFTPLLSVMLTVFCLDRRTLSNDTLPIPNVRWWGFLPLIFTMGLNFLLPLDPFIQGFIIGPILVVIGFMFRVSNRDKRTASA